MKKESKLKGMVQKAQKFAIVNLALIPGVKPEDLEAKSVNEYVPMNLGKFENSFNTLDKFYGDRVYFESKKEGEYN